MLRTCLKISSKYFNPFSKLKVSPHNIPVPTLKSRTCSAEVLYPLSAEVQNFRELAHALLQPNPFWKSNAGDRLALRELIRKYQEKFEGSVAPLKSSNPSDQWFLADLMLTMRAFDNFYLHSYHETEEANTCSKAILPSHAASISKSLEGAFATNTHEQRFILAAALEAPILEKYKIVLGPSEALQADQLRGLQQALLNEDELIALLDYLDPYSMTFNVINGGSRLKTFWGLDGIAKGSAIVARPYYNALEKLFKNPAFADKSGIYYKGLVMKGSHVPMKRLLDYLADRQGLVFPPHPISTTSDVSQSFAAQANRDEDSEIVIRSSAGVNVSAFHGSFGKQLNEVILLPTAMRVRKREMAIRRSQPVTQYMLEAAPLARKSRQR